MAWVSRLFSWLPSPGVPIVNDLLFQSVGNALTTTNTTTLGGSGTSAFFPTISKGYVRAKVYGGLSTPTLASISMFLSDGVEFVCIYNSGVWATAITLSATPGGTALATNGAMASASAILTSASNPFTPQQVGRTIAVSAAGNTGGTIPLYTTIASYQSAGQVTLAAATLQTGGTSGATVTLTESYLGSGSISAPAGVDFLFPFEIDINSTRLDVVTTGAGTSFMDLEISGTT